MKETVCRLTTYTFMHDITYIFKFHNYNYGEERFQVKSNAADILR